MLDFGSLIPDSGSLKTLTVQGSRIQDPASSYKICKERKILTYPLASEVYQGKSTLSVKNYMYQQWLITFIIHNLLMKIILFLLSLFTSNISFAHPGIGIVKDSKGNIYYTDLHDVWKISPGGARTIAVHNVHTHELYMDANDDLYGEHLWYNGETLDTWGYYVWCLRSNNKLDTVIKPTAGFLKNYSFARDAKGNMYWVERDSVNSFVRRSPDGKIDTILQGKFKDVRWIHSTKGGAIYFIDLYDLYKIDNAGQLSLIAKNIPDNTPSFGLMGGKHSLFGIWTDSIENVYVANLSGQVVKRITPAGKVEDFVYSVTPWSPTGGLFDNNGNLWLLETSLTNEARTRKISASQFNKGKTTPVILRNYILPLGVFALIIAAIVLIIRVVWRKRKRLKAQSSAGLH